MTDWRDELRDFQRAHGIVPADGKLGPITWPHIRRYLPMQKPSADPGLGGFSFGGPQIRKGVDRDPTKLLPGFAVKVELLFQRLRARGLDPLLWEAYRTPERAAELEREGTGIALSMHCLGAAVDIIERTRYWDAPSAFWDAIGEEADGLDLTWGGHWRRADRPHVQAIPVHEQRRFRAMNEQQRAERVA